jgi:peptidyl-prolyl cis-trans isomerase A (cyclophilin A)
MERLRQMVMRDGHAAVAAVVLLFAIGCTGRPPAPSAGQVIAASPTPAQPTPAPNPLLTPALATQTAPDVYKVNFETTRGKFTVQVTRAWAPLGADRLYNLVKIGFYDDVAFFRVVPDFVVQFGLSGQPRVNEAWGDAHIPDDPVGTPNRRGTVTFATSGPDTRTTQLFINLKDNPALDRMGFAPVGTVTEGMPVVQDIYPGAGERPDQGLIQLEGNAYLRREFPRLDYIRKATIAEPPDQAAQSDPPAQPE